MSEQYYPSTHTMGINVDITLCKFLWSTFWLNEGKYIKLQSTVDKPPQLLQVP